MAGRKNRALKSRWVVMLVTAAGLGCAAPHPSPSSERAVFRYDTVVGTQTILPAYGFSKQDRLVETAHRIRDMGSSTIKMALTARYCTADYHLPRDPSIHCLCDLAERQPSVKAVLDMRFSNYIFWAYAFSQYRGGDSQQSLASFQDGLSAGEASEVYREIHDLVAYLLKAYSGTGKTFYLGHWEGDWHLRWDYDRQRPLRKEAVDGMVRWLNVRQEAIDDAKRETPHHDVDVFGYTEVNLVQRGLHGQPCAVTEVLPNVDVDYVSYSAWDATNKPASAEALRQKLVAGLDFIEGHLRPRPDLPPGKRVWIGEFGYPAISYSEAEADRNTRWVLRTGLEWGCPFVLYWELYNNEVEPGGRQRGYWMIDDHGRKTQVYRTYAAFYREAGAFLRSFVSRNGRIPTRREFAAAALGFPSLRPN